MCMVEMQKRSSCSPLLLQHHIAHDRLASYLVRTGLKTEPAYALCMPGDSTGPLALRTTRFDRPEARWGPEPAESGQDEMSAVGEYQRDLTDGSKRVWRCVHTSRD